MIGMLLKIGKRTKIWINYLLDRITDLCHFCIFWSGRLPAFIENWVKSASYFIGNLTLLLYDFPRMNAYQMKSADWSVIFVGGQVGRMELQDVLFEDQEVMTQPMERVVAWKLPQISKAWLEAGADLVICELSRLFPWKLPAAQAFTGPDWVMQVVDIPASPEELLAGRRLHGQRNRVRNSEKQGFEYHFSRSLDDYDHFYHEMYLPFVQTRHQEQALIVPMKDQYKRWFKPGGLILVTQNDQPVAGELVVRIKKNCYSIEMGVLHCDPVLIEAGVNAFLQWSTIRWCHSHGVKQYVLGGSQAWCSNGAYKFKAKWGARVVKQKRITPLRHFLSSKLSDSLRDRINQIEFISEEKGKFYRTCLAETDPENLDKWVQDAVDHGLSGIALVQDGSTRFLTV